MSLVFLILKPRYITNVNPEFIEGGNQDDLAISTMGNIVRSQWFAYLSALAIAAPTVPTLEGC